MAALPVCLVQVGIKVVCVSSLRVGQVDARASRAQDLVCNVAEGAPEPLTGEELDALQPSDLEYR